MSADVRLRDPRPNAAAYHHPDPQYLRGLVERAGVTQASAAHAIGISPRQMRYYLSLSDDHQAAPYSVQFALERLAADA